MKVQSCPKCKSNDIELDTGGQTGKYKCKKCGYIGPLIVEKDIESNKDSKNKKQDKDNSFLYSMIMVMVVIAVIGLILVGIKVFSPKDLDDIRQEIVEKGETEHGYMYNGFVFIEQGGLWHTQLQRGDELYNLHFHYSPGHVDQISVVGSLDSELDTSRFYITFDPLEENVSLIALALSELNLNLVKGLGAKTTAACYKNETKACYNRPIITCDNTEEAVIFVKTDDATKVMLDGNCIVIQGKGDDLLKAVDKVLFDFYGITEHKMD